MEVKAVRRARDKAAAGGAVVPAGSYRWAVVHEISVKEVGSVKASFHDGQHVFVATRRGVNRWNTTDGSAEMFAEASSLPAVAGALLVTRGIMWVCMVDGSVLLFDTQTLEPKRKAFPAHNGEVLSIMEAAGGDFIVTGGADFQVKAWAPDGTFITGSGHHHGAVECLLATSQEDGSRARYWSGSTDGTIFAWSDETRSGRIDESSGKILKSEAQKGVVCMVQCGEEVWCGCDDGKVVVWNAADDTFRRAIRVHTGRVAAIAVVGTEVWTGSADKTIAAIDAASYSILYTLGDQGGYIKSILPTGWCIWTVNSAALRVFTAETLMQLQATKAEIAEQEAQDAKSTIVDLQVKVGDLQQDAANKDIDLQKANGLLGDKAKQMLELQDAHTSQGATIQDLQRQLAQEKQQRLDLEKKNKEEMASMQKANNELNMKLVQMETEHDQERKALESRVAMLQQEYEASQVAVGDGEEKWRILKEQLRSELDDKDKELAAARSQCDDVTKALKDQTDAKAAANNALKQAEAVTEALRSQLQQVQSKLQATEKQYDDARRDLAAQAAQTEAVQQQSDDLRAQLAAKIQQADNNAEQLDQAMRKIKDVQSALAAANDDAVKKGAESAAREASLKQSMEDATRGHAQELKQCRQEMDTLQQRLQATEGSSSEQQKVLIDSQDKLKQQAAELSALQEQLLASETAIRSLHEKMASASALHEEARSLEATQRAKMQEEVASLQQRISSLQADGARSQKQVAEAEQAAARADEERDKLQTQHGQLQHQLQESNSTQQQLQQQLADLQNLVHTLGGNAATQEQAVLQATERATAAQKERDEMAAVARRLEESLQAALQDKKALEARVADVNNQLANATEAASNTGQKLAEVEHKWRSMEDRTQEAESTAVYRATRISELEQQLAAADHQRQQAAKTSERLQGELQLAQQEVLQLKKTVEEAASSGRLEGELAALKQRVQELEGQLGGTRSPSISVQQIMPGNAGIQAQPSGQPNREAGSPLDTQEGSNNQQQAAEAPKREVEEAKKKAAEDNQKLQKELDTCMQELNKVLEDRYQLQVALKASQRSAAAAQANAELQAKLREMENSLRQATKDYQLILQELASIRKDCREKDSVLSQERQAREELASQVDLLEQQLARYKQECHMLEGQLGMLEMRQSQAHRDSETLHRTLTGLHATHETVKQRILADTHSLVARPAARPPSAEGWQIPAGQPQLPSHTLYSQASGYTTPRTPERVRHLPPTGFMG